MKVLGTSQVNGDKALIVEIPVTELEYLLGSFYQKPIRGNNRRVDALHSGDEVDIKYIYSMTHSLESICDAMIKANKAFEENSKVILNFAEMVTSAAHEEGKNG